MKFNFFLTWKIAILPKRILPKCSIFNLKKIIRGNFHEHPSTKFIPKNMKYTLN